MQVLRPSVERGRRCFPVPRGLPPEPSCLPICHARMADPCRCAPSALPPPQRCSPPLPRTRPAARNEWGETALQVSARMGHADVVALLLRAGARCDLHNSWHDTPLHTACRHGRHKVGAHFSQATGGRASRWKGRVGTGPTTRAGAGRGGGGVCRAAAAAESAPSAVAPERSLLITPRAPLVS